MTSHQQRFCPLCDRAFADGEAVLRCDGCGVMHHPGCWVKNGGCATPREHSANAIALAYQNSPPVISQAPHPGEGTRVRIPPLGALPGQPEDPDDEGARQPVPLAPRLAPPPLPPSPATQPVIDEFEPPPSRARAPYNPEPTQGREKRPPRERRQPPAHHPQKPLPMVYRHHQILRYWYVPAALLLAIAVAWGVIWVAGQFTGGDENKAPAIATATPPPASPTAGTPGSPTAKPTGSSSPTATAGSGTSQKFRPNDVAVVVGTGDCLNVRVAPGRANDAIICLADGEQVTVSGGPEAKDNIQWWKVKTKSGEGWAAEDYLVKKP